MNPTGIRKDVKADVWNTLIQQSKIIGLPDGVLNSRIGQLKVPFKSEIYKIAVLSSFDAASHNDLIASGWTVMYAIDASSITNGIILKCMNAVVAR